ncbi:MAG: hypothetical protein M3N34_05315 [Pseudomonadota bacterium]|nr:hypothetical protein [Pseudomonadota bacterium]
MSPVATPVPTAFPFWSSERHEANNWRNSTSPLPSPELPNPELPITDCCAVWAARSGAEISALSLLFAKAGAAMPMASIESPTDNPASIRQEINANFDANTKTTLILAVQLAPRIAAAHNPGRERPPLILPLLRLSGYFLSWLEPPARL